MSKRDMKMFFEFAGKGGTFYEQSMKKFLVRFDDFRDVRRLRDLCRGLRGLVGGEGGVEGLEGVGGVGELLGRMGEVWGRGCGGVGGAEVERCVLEFVVKGFVQNVHFFDEEGFFEIYFHFSNSYKLQLAPDQLRDKIARYDDDGVDSGQRFTKRKTLNINVNSPMFFCNLPDAELSIFDQKPQFYDSHSPGLS